MAVNLNTSLGSTALAALQDLNNTQTQLNQTADVVGSDVSVANPEDNPAVWSIAQQQNMQVSGLQAVAASLSRATSISDVASSAGQQVVTLLDQLKQDALSASETTLDSSSRQAYNADFKSTLAQISQTVNGATFDGANLLNGSQTGISAMASADGGSTLTLSAQNLSLGGPNITLSSTASIGTASQASAMLSAVGASLANVNNALAALGVQSSQISDHSSFVGQFSDTLQAGVGDLVNADLGAESARLAALQVQQQMSVQALSVANQAPSVILSMFR